MERTACVLPLLENNWCCQYLPFDLWLEGPKNNIIKMQGNILLFVGFGWYCTSYDAHGRLLAYLMVLHTLETENKIKEILQIRTYPFS